MMERNRQKLETGWPTLLSQHSAGRTWARHVAIATSQPHVRRPGWWNVELTESGLVQRTQVGISNHSFILRKRPNFLQISIVGEHACP